MHNNSKKSKMALFTFFILICLTSPLLHSTTAMITTANTTRSTTASSGLVDQICELSTTDIAFCHAILDPAKTTDLYKLSYVAFGSTYDNATSIREYINSWLRPNAKNAKPGMKEGMQDCKGYYEEAIGALLKVSKDLKKRYFKRLEELAKYVEELGLGCAVAFEYGYPDAFMAKENQNFINLASICVIVSDLLTRVVVVN